MIQPNDYQVIDSLNQNQIRIGSYNLMKSLHSLIILPLHFIEFLLWPWYYIYKIINYQILIYNKALYGHNVGIILILLLWRGYNLIEVCKVKYILY